MKTCASNPDIPLGNKLSLSQKEQDQINLIHDEVGENALNTVIDEGVDLTHPMLSIVNC